MSLFFPAPIQDKVDWYYHVEYVDSGETRRTMSHLKGTGINIRHPFNQLTQMDTIQHKFDTNPLGETFT